MIQNFSTKNNSNWNKMIQKLVVENCLNFGHHSGLTSKKVTQYLIGTRVTTEIFKLYDGTFKTIMLVTQNHHFVTHNH